MLMKCSIKNRHSHIEQTHTQITYTFDCLKCKTKNARYINMN